MPKVNGKEFEYSSEGIKEAKKHAEITGGKISHDYPSYDAGGRVEKYPHGGEVNPSGPLSPPIWGDNPGTGGWPSGGGLGESPEVEMSIMGVNRKY